MANHLKIRMATTISIGSPNCIGRCPTEPSKPLSRVERTKSFLKASLIKKWKSSKELFSNLTGNDNNGKPTRKQIENKLQNGKFINEKVLDNLDEFERNFLLSAGRKILVRELRKNFEKPPYNNRQATDLNCGNNVIQQQCNRSPTKMKASNLLSDQPKRFANASVQTIPNYDDDNNDNVHETKVITPSSNQKKPLVMRHSFYNTYRNEYCAWQNSHYASNLSLISYGNPSNSEKCLEKTINKYKNSIKSSSAVDLSSISSVVLNTTMSPTSMTTTTIDQSIGKSTSMLKRHYSSIINISHSNSTQNLTDSPIIDYSYNSIDTTPSTFSMVNKPMQKNAQLKPTHSIKSLNTISSNQHDGMNNVQIRFRNGDDDTKSLIVTSTTSSSVLYDSPQNNDVSTCHFNTYVSKTDLYGSNLMLADTNINNNNNIINNINNNNNIINNNNNDTNNYEYSLPLNCHTKNINMKNDKTIETNVSHNHNQDGNNNTTTTKIRKCYSINQIDLSLLKNELDEYIDRELRTTNFGRNTLAQRRSQFECNLKKVKVTHFFAPSFSISNPIIGGMCIICNHLLCLGMFQFVNYI